MNPAAVPLPFSFYNRDVQQVARELIGKMLYRRSRSGLTAGCIVETEAYLADGDSASHSFNGINRKNASMFGPAGRAYVYTIHARQCFNVVTADRGVASAVLVRAIRPLVGLTLMHRRRQTEELTDLCRGPARLCEAMQIERTLDGWSLTTGQRIWISSAADLTTLPVRTSSRIGVTSAEDLPLRFFVPNNAFVSGPRKLNRT